MSVSERFWEVAKSFSQELVTSQEFGFQPVYLLKRDEKGKAVIKRDYLGSEFTAGPQELDTINLACPADVKGGGDCTHGSCLIPASASQHS